MLLVTIMGGILRLLLLAVLALGMSLGILLYSEAGTRWTLGTLDHLAGDRMQFSEVEGSLPRGLTLSGALVRTEALEIAVQQLYLRWEPQGLLRHELWIPDLQVRNIRVTVHQTESESETEPEGWVLPDSLSFPMGLDLDRLQIENLQFIVGGEVQPTIGLIELSVKAVEREIQVRRRAMEVDGARLSLEGSIILDREFPIRVNGSWQADIPEEVALHLKHREAWGRWALTGDLRSRLELEHELDAGIRITSAVEILEPLGNVRLISRHEWSAFEVALDSGESIHIESGSLRASGTAEAWQASIQAAISAAGWPALEMAGEIQGNPHLIRLETLVLTADRSRLDASGHLELEDAMPFALSIQASDLNLAPLWPEGSPQIDALNLSVVGEQPVDLRKLQATLDIVEMRGTMAGQPLHIVGRVSSQGLETIAMETIRIIAGDNRLAMNGYLGEFLELQWELRGQNLALLAPGLSGQLNAEGTLTGSRAEPRLSASARFRDLRHDDLALGNGQIEVDAGLALQDPFQLEIGIENAAIGTTEISNLTIHADGKASAHRVKISAHALGRLTTILEARGSYTPDVMEWSGVLSLLEIEDVDLGPWQLTEPSRVRASASVVSLETTCLADDEVRICASGQWDTARGATMSGKLEAFDLARLETWWPDSLTISGVLGASFAGESGPDGTITARLDLQPMFGTVEYTGLPTEDLSIDYRDLALSVRLDGGDLIAILGIDFNEMGNVAARLEARLDAPDIPISGQGQIMLQRLDWLGFLTDAIEDPAGQIEADLRLDGTLKDPRPSGHLRLHSAQIGIPETGLMYTTPLLALEFDERGQGSFSGSIHSGDTSLTLGGEIRTDTDGPSVTMNLYGLNFHVIGREDVEAWISPNLQLTWNAAEAIRVRGSIVIPKLLIDAPEVPEGAITVSADEYISEEAIQERTTGTGIDLSIRIILGEEVRFDGFGLLARFRGEVDLTQPENAPLQAFGEILIVEGQYRSYGQDLRIDRGSVLFQGPLADPSLDIRAERRIRRPEVVVGVHIGGSASALRSSLFSEPPMDDTEALSFLLTGRPLGGRSDASTAQLLTNAATGWGLDQAAVITQRLGRDLGLTELDLDTDSDEFEGGALIVGQQLSPRLLLRYSVGLFERGQKLMLQYEITESLRLETSSTGEQQGADLIYRIER